MQSFCDDGYEAFAFSFPLAKLVYDEQFRAVKAALDRHDGLLERTRVEDATPRQTTPVFAYPNDWPIGKHRKVHIAFPPVRSLVI